MFFTFHLIRSRTLSIFTIFCRLLLYLLLLLTVRLLLSFQFIPHKSVLLRGIVCTNQIQASADEPRLSQDCDWSGLFIYFGIDQ